MIVTSNHLYDAKQFNPRGDIPDGFVRDRLGRYYLPNNGLKLVLEGDWIISDGHKVVICHDKDFLEDYTVKYE